MTIEFLITAVVVALVPGIGVIYTVSSALVGGWRAGVAAAFGCTLGILPHLAASVVGLAALLHASAVAFQTVKLVGVAYLLWLAWGLWREAGAGAPADTTAPRTHARVAARAVLINLLNPKLSIFFLSLLPQFVPADEGRPVALMLVLSATFMAATFVVFVGYGVAASAVRSRIVNGGRAMAWLRRGLAGMIALLGLRLALAEGQR